MSNTLHLDKLKLIGDITDTTPFCVIIDLCRSIGMSDEYIKSKSLDSLISEMKKHSKIVISLDSDEDLSNLARFINPDEESWSPYGLIVAHTLLLEFDLASFCFDAHTFGPRTMKNPKSVDTITLYRLCEYYLIPTTRNTTFEEMVFSLQKNNTLVRNESLGQSLEEIYNCLQSSTTRFYKYLLPTDNLTAVLFSAFAFGIDVSFSEFPLKEYFLLRKYGIYAFVPFDDSFRDMWNVSKTFFEIRERFNPKFDFIYTDEMKIHLSLKEGFQIPRRQNFLGYSEDDAKEGFKYLKNIYTTSTFYFGKNPLDKSKRSAISLTDFDELNENEVISYGNYSTLSFVSFTFQELREYFSEVKCFLNPCDTKSVYSLVSINKLQRICVTTPSSEAKKLKDVLNSLISQMKNLSDEEMELIKVYTSSPSDEKEIFKYVLTSILEMGMYFRGWKVTVENYPITTEECLKSPGDESQILSNSIKALKDFETFILSSKKVEKISAFILSLPLVEFKNSFSYGSVIFVKSTNKNEGLTIGDRIKIVDEGEDEYSCIRMSSNPIVSSAYKYLSIIGEKPEFNIEKMGRIS